MSRVTRIGIGLVALIPVLGLTGALFRAMGIDGEAGAWMALGVAVAWIALIIWWGLRGPIQRTEELRGRYLAFLRHAEYQPRDSSDSGARGRRH